MKRFTLAALATVVAACDGGDAPPPIKLPPPIEETPTHVNIDGVVLKPDGTPAAGAVLQLIGGAITAVTGAAGDYELTHLPVGAWPFDITLDTNLDGTPEFGLHAQVLGEAAPQSKQVVAPTVTLAGTAEITGTLVRGGQPVDGASIVLSLSAETRTTAGAFAFKQVVAGTYDVTAVLVEGENVTLSPRTSVTVGGGETKTVALSLDAPPTRGLVRGSLAGFAGHPDGVVEFVAATAKQVTPSADGQWGVADSLAPGIYVVRGRAAGVRTSVLPFVVVGGELQVLPALLLSADDGCNGLNSLDNDGDGTPDATEPEACRCLASGSVDVDTDGLCDSIDRDDDGDGVPDSADKCPGIADDQDDSDNDGIGDLCEADTDEDGVIDDHDNCITIDNNDQQDTDGDGRGNPCDPNIDDDLFANDADNCDLVKNDDQKDQDLDGTGDACDGDLDGDGKNNDEDNCPFVDNAGQQNPDNDAFGSACDNCPGLANDDQADGDDDGIGDLCDTPASPTDARINGGGFTAKFLGPTNSPITAIGGTSLSDIWISALPAQLFHWNGQKWSLVRHPGEQNALQGIASGAAGTFTWGGEVQRWSGSQWEVIDTGGGTGQLVVPPTGTDLYGNFNSLVGRLSGGVVTTLGTLAPIAIAVGGPGNDLFALAATATNSPARWDGTDWVTVPGLPLNSGEFCSSMSGTPAGVWMHCFVSRGGKPFLSFWNGTTWDRFASTYPPGTLDTVSIVGTTATEAFVLAQGGSVHRWTPSGWNVLLPPRAEWTTIWSPAPGKIVLGAKSGQLAIFDGTTWTVTGVEEAPRMASLSGSSLTDLWGVDNATGRVLHRTAAGWQTVNIGDPRRVTSVRAYSPTVVYAAGADGLVARGNATDGFTNVTDGPAATTELLYGLTGSGPNDVWVSYSRQTASWRFDGAGWQQFSGATTDVHTVGTGGWRINGPRVYAWTSAGSETIEYNAGSSIAALWGMGGDLFAAGPGSLISRRNGTTNAWSAIPSPNLEELTDVWGSALNDVWFSTQNYLMYWDGSTFTRHEVPGHRIANLVGISSTEIYATGSLLKFDGAKWNVLERTDSPRIIPGGFASTGADSGWFTGYEGYYGDQPLVHYDAGALTLYDAPIQEGYSVKAMAASGPANVWIAGYAGKLLHFDGTRWNVVMTDHDGADVAIVTRAANDTWVISEVGTVHHWDGTAFSEVSTMPAGYWKAITVTPSGKIVVVGDEEKIAIRTGTTWAEVTTAPRCIDETSTLTFSGVDARTIGSTETILVNGGNCLLKFAAGAWTSLPLDIDTLRIARLLPDGSVLATQLAEISDGSGEGGHVDMSTVVRFNGTAWLPVALPSLTGIRALDVRDDGTVFVVGDYGTVFTGRLTP